MKKGTALDPTKEIGINEKQKKNLPKIKLVYLLKLMQENDQIHFDLEILPQNSIKIKVFRVY